MPSLSDLRFDLTGWNPEGVTESTAQWNNAAGDLLTLHHFSLPPDLPGPLEDIARLRSAYRDNLRQVGGGLVELETVEVAGLRAIHAIFKLRQNPTGMAYVASLTLPFEDFSYVFKVHCPEHGTTGVRDNTVLAQVMAEVKPSTHEELQRWLEDHWAQDPYEPSDRSPVRRNRSDDPRYDAQFPDHPLSRARRDLADMERTLRVSTALLQARPFTRPSAARQDAPRLLPNPRHLHYDFAHRALPHLFLKDPDQFLGALHHGQSGFLERLWKFVAKDLPPEEFIAPDGLNVGFQFDNESAVAVVSLPPARAVAEAVLVGFHFWTSPAARQAARAPARYFTLELGVHKDGSLRTVLAEWEQSWERHNYGDGPNPTPEAFIAAIRALVQRPR